MNQELKKFIQALEVELLQPNVRKSAERLNELLAKDFLEFGGSGNTYNKKEILDTLPTLDEVQYVVRNFQIREISPDTVLATYHLEKEDVPSGNKSQSLRSSLWQKHNGTWQMFFHQGTPQK